MVTIKAVDACHFVFNSVLDRYKTREMCDRAVDYFLPAIKLVPDSLVTSNMIKKLYSALFTDNDIFFFDEYSGNATFSSAYLNNINIILTLMILIFMRTILKLLFLSDLWLCAIQINNAEHLEKI